MQYEIGSNRTIQQRGLKLQVIEIYSKLANQDVAITEQLKVYIWQVTEMAVNFCS